MGSRTGAEDGGGSALCTAPNASLPSVRAATRPDQVGRFGNRTHPPAEDDAGYSADPAARHAGAQDGTVRLWEAESGKLLATFLVLPDEEWIIYTPEGRYAGSSAAEQYILWKSGDDLISAPVFSSTFRSLEKLPLSERP